MANGSEHMPEGVRIPRDDILTAAFERMHGAPIDWEHVKDRSDANPDPDAGEFISPRDKDWGGRHWPLDGKGMPDA